MFLKLILDILLSQRVENKAVRTVYYIMFKEYEAPKRTKYAKPKISFGT